jgi:predicted MFS family arabinose efflux permease
MSYAWRVTILLAAIWGMVGLERLVVGYVLIGIQKEFSLSYTQAAVITGVFGVTWAVGVWAMGSLSDLRGRRPLIATLTVLGGVLSWVTGVATSYGMLVAVRAVMGFIEGGIWSPLSATVLEAAGPRHRGRNIGIAAGSFLLVSGVFGPIVSIALMARLGWRPVFFVYALPAILLGLLAWVLIKEPQSVQNVIDARRRGQARPKLVDEDGQEIRYLDVFRRRNVLLAAVGTVLVLAALFLFTTFGVVFLVRVHHIAEGTVGAMLSIGGVCSFLASLCGGVIADRIGRRTALIAFELAAGVMALLFAALSPTAGTALMGATVLVLMFCAGLSASVLWAVTAESVGFGLAASAIGFVTACGELLGGGLMQVVGGGLADLLGLTSTFYLYAGLHLAVAIGVGPWLKETLRRAPQQAEPVVT